MIDQGYRRCEAILEFEASTISARFDVSAYRRSPQSYLAGFIKGLGAEFSSLSGILPGIEGMVLIIDGHQGLPGMGAWWDSQALSSARTAADIEFLNLGGQSEDDPRTAWMAELKAGQGAVWLDAPATASPSSGSLPLMRRAIPLVLDTLYLGALAIDYRGSPYLSAPHTQGIPPGSFFLLSSDSTGIIGNSKTDLSPLDFRRLDFLARQGLNGESRVKDESHSRSTENLAASSYDFPARGRVSLDSHSYLLCETLLSQGWRMRFVIPGSGLLMPLYKEGIVFLLSLLAVLGVALGISVFLSRMVSKPLRDFISRPIDVAAGIMASLPENSGPLEIRKLALTLNQAFSEVRRKSSQQRLLMESDARIDLLSLDLEAESISSTNGFKLFGFDKERESPQMDFRAWVERFHIRVLEKSFNPLLSQSYSEQHGQELLAFDLLRNLRGLSPGVNVQRSLVYDTLMGEERYMRVNIIRVSRDLLLAACVDLTEEYRARREFFVLSTRLSHALNATQSVAIFDVSTETMELWASESFFPIFELDMPSAGSFLLPSFEKRLLEGTPPLLDPQEGSRPADFWKKGSRVLKLNLPRSGSQRWVEVRTAETMRGVIGTVIDITREVLEKKAALEKADTAQELSRVILSALSEAVFGLGPDGRCIFMNPAAEHLLGYESAELVGLPLEPIFTLVGAEGMPVDLDSNPLHRTLVNHSNSFCGNGRFKRKDGSFLHADFRAQPIFRGSDFIGAVVTLVDVSGLVELSTRFSAILANAVDQLYIKDRDLRMTMVSDSILKAMGLSLASQILGKTSLDIFPPELALDFYEAEQGVLRSGQPIRDLVLNYPYANGSRWLNISVIPMRDEHGEIIGIFGIARDITDAYRLDDELRAAKDSADRANQAKSVFLAGMSHEIRTPLNAILGYSQLMEGDNSLSHDQRRKVETIMRAGEHLLDLINSILEISKIEAGRVHPFMAATDMYRLVEDIEAMFRLRTEAKGLILHVRRDPSLPRWILSDVQKLRQILINLLGNAVKFTEKGGISLHVIPAGDKLAMEVRDSGPGVNDEDMERIFRPFEQGRAGIASQGGTGLGLAISNEYALLLGGGISVRRAEGGQGSVFRCEIALIETHAAENPDDGIERNIICFSDKEHSPLILNVDDSQSNRDLVNDILLPIGFRVQDAENGLEALAAFKDIHPDLILMDIAMPVMDGLEAIARIRASDGGSPIPIIAITAGAFEEDRRKVMAAGANDFIRKPLDRDELLEKIGKALGIEYRYDEIVSDESLGLVGADRSFDLGSIPAELKAELRKAAVELAPFQAEVVVKSIGRIDADLAAELTKLLARFDFQAIIRMLDEEGE